MNAQSDLADQIENFAKHGQNGAHVIGTPIQRGMCGWQLLLNCLFVWLGKHSQVAKRLTEIGQNLSNRFFFIGTRRLKSSN